MKIKPTEKTNLEKLLENNKDKKNALKKMILEFDKKGFTTKISNKN
ncbi:MAG: hypothetical protein KDC94_03335 [Aequorivita sp.]|nr:hypothetical protein [Aequorivita sp.]MCB0454485.1 hypothetical protein [Aequorivita sp.]